MEDKAHEVMACDYFVDTLNDPILELKIREKTSRRLDATYKEALNLEMWQQNVKERTTFRRTPSLDRADAF